VAGSPSLLFTSLKASLTVYLPLLSNLVAMLRYDLFTYRDLWEWINNPFETLPIVHDAEELSLMVCDLDSICRVNIQKKGNLILKKRYYLSKSLVLHGWIS